MVSGPVSATKITWDSPVERPLMFNVTMEIPIEVWPGGVLGDFDVEEVRELMENVMDGDTWTDGRYAFHEELQMDGVQRELKRALSSAIEGIMEKRHGRELQEVKPGHSQAAWYIKAQEWFKANAPNVYLMWDRRKVKINGVPDNGSG